MADEVETRQATAEDAVTLARLRGVMQAANGVAEADIALNLNVWEQWFAHSLETGEYVAFLGEMDGQAVGTVGLMFYPQMPSVIDTRTTRPQVVNVAVMPTCRGRGVATTLLEVALAWAHAAGFHHLGLNGAPMGLSLYRRLGFRENANPAMTLRLPAQA